MRASADPTTLADRLRGGDRRALARAITLVESTRESDARRAARLLTALDGAGEGALRVGMTGTPGVGKSTLIEALGLDLVAAGRRVGVLAVDPSSARSGGAILGDKTRMPHLARAEAAFIRPSPSRASLGGVARRSREVAALMAAAGHDPVLIETVGVGQSETMVAEMCDIFVLIIAPAGGDELQGVKRGIMELADVILVNKADGALAAAAERTRADYAAALRLLRARPEDREGGPKVMCVSAETGTGLDAAWAEVESLARWRRQAGHLARRRAAQARFWFEEELRARLLARLRTPEARRLVGEAAGRVAAGRVDAAAAAIEVLDRLEEAG